MFWICAGNSVDYIEIFSLLLSSAHTASRPFLLLVLPHQQVGWGCTRSREGTQSGQPTPAGQTDMPYGMTSCSAYKVGARRRKKGDVQSDGVCLPKSPLHMMEPCCPGDGWTSACHWEAVNEFLVLLCLCAHLLLYPLNCLYLNPQIFSFLLFQLSPPSHQRGVGERLPGVKPQHSFYLCNTHIKHCCSVHTDEHMDDIYSFIIWKIFH